MPFPDPSRWIRFVFPLLLALFLGILMFLMAQFREPPVLTGYAVGWFLGSVVLIWEAGWRVSARLDRTLPWRAGVFRRLLWQVVAVSVVGISGYLLSFVLLNAYENRVLGHDNALGILHLQVAGALGFLIVQIINSIQVGYQLLQSWREVEREAERGQKDRVIARLEDVRRNVDAFFLDRQLAELPDLLREAPERVNDLVAAVATRYQRQQSAIVENIAAAEDRLRSSPAREAAPVPDRNARPKERFLVRTGNRYFVVPTSEVVAFYKDQLVLLFTTTGKRYPVDYSLEELAACLDPGAFYRINRQCLVHSRYLDEMRMEEGQLRVQLRVAFPYPLTVSQRNLGGFKRWLEAPPAG